MFIIKGEVLSVQADRENMLNLFSWTEFGSGRNEVVRGRYMSAVEESTKQLVDTIKNSIIYQNYQNCRKEIQQYPEKMQALQEFRMRNYELQNSTENIDLYNEIDKLEQRYSSYRNDPIVETYLEAENSFFRLLRKVNWEIIESLDVEQVLRNG